MGVFLGVLFGLVIGIGLTLMFMVNIMSEADEQYKQLDATFHRYIHASNELEKHTKKHHRDVLRAIGDELDIDSVKTPYGIIVLRDKK